MTTTAIPPAPPPDARISPVQPNRFVAIRANLLPPEIADKRRLRQLKRRSGIALLAIVALLAGWYVLAMLQTSSAHSDLTSAQHRNRSLLTQEQQFGPVVTAQAASAAIHAQLALLMVGDVNWKTMLAALRQTASGGVQVTAVTAAIQPTAATGNTTGGGLGVLNQTGKQPVGTLTISGTAPDKNAVAAFVERLAKVTGLASPFPASVSGDKSTVTFTADVIITSDAFGGRYSANSTSTGGH
jgi:Tfp pilus assembly protein PilN